jgi:beta-glucanase (GH16 family)
VTYYNYLGVAMPQTALEASNISGTSAGNETVQAPAGASSVSGNGGGDVLVGSSGDNSFFITNPGDRVVEQANAGIDTEIAYTSTRLAPNVENLTVHQDFNYAVGNDLNNLIVVDGSQWVDGEGGNDVLVGSATQRTTFLEKAGQGSDVIYNWNGNSQLQLSGYSGFNTAADVRAHMTQVGSDTVLQLSSSEALTFRAITPAAFADRQFLSPLDTSKLGAMTFDDEFNSLQLRDPSTGAGLWQTNFGGNLKDQYAYSLVSNGEQQEYVAPGFQGRGQQDLGINPFSVEGGVLTITASATPAQDNYAAYGAAYTSGMLNTLGSFEQKYGYFEMRAEVPTAQGAWPAFWLLPSPYQPNAEADIMEGLGATPNVDYRRAYGGDGSSQTIYDNAYKDDPSGFHTYGMLWTPSTVSFYYDGTEVLQGATPSTWTSPMAMIVNLAVGGWGGTPNAAQFPAQLNIDYVRAYALADGSSQVVQATPTAPVATLHDDGAASGQSAISQVFQATGAAVASAHIQVLAAHPTTLPAGQSFEIWEDSGAVFGAVSNGGALAAPTALMAGDVGVFTGTGTWLTDGKVVAGYLQPNASGGQDLWDLVFDPAKLSFVKQDLGPAASAATATFVATGFGGFAVSWHAPGGAVMARGYDEYAYGGDVPGWYGPARQITGDLIGVDAQGQVIAANGSGRELYTLVGASVAPAGTGASSPGVASAGNDVLQAQSGATEIHAGTGDDTITGWSGGDYLRGDDGNDLITGGSGFDDINGNKGDDTISGGSGGGDWLVGGQGNDLISAATGDGLIYGNLGNDTLTGGGGNEIVRGGQGDDVLFGGAGNDFLSGDRGNDTITGGAGADIFHTFSGAGLDRVTDFSVAQGDRVMVDAGTTYSVSQSGADTVINMGGGDQMVLVGVQVSTLTGGWIFTA